jgi:Alpha/beta hydrolase domain
VKICSNSSCFQARRAAGILCSLIAGLILAGTVDARITKIVITRTESPTFGGTSFGTVGPYEKLVGRSYGGVDPTDRHSAMITDIGLAPRNARGMVEYSTDIYIFKPVDLSKGNHKLFFESNNRGSIRSFSVMNDAKSGGNDPTTAADAGNGYLMREGYTIVLSGWDITVAPGKGRLTMTVPVATNPDGSPVTGPALEEFVVDDTTTMTGKLTYPAATLDKSSASLTVRVLYSDQPVPVAPENWQYVDARSIRLLPVGTPLQNGRLYEFTYTARDPLLAGLGFAGVRDLIAFLRHTTVDSIGTPNPLAGDVKYAYSFTSSQPSRFIHDFLYFGFNQDEQGQQVFDGILSWLGGASGGFFNYRFAQPGRTHRQHVARWYPERQFPFADQVTFDPVTGKSDGRLRRCLATQTCPKIFEVNSENEYWAKAGSLLHTDTRGKDLPDPPNTRFYLLSSLPHGVANGPGICQQPRNPLAPGPSLRALLVAMDEWVTAGTKPPDSRIPRRRDGTLVPSLPQSATGFPVIEGFTYNGRLHEGDLLDYGSSFSQGLFTLIPPKLLRSPYPALVPKTDQDGNDIAGIRMVDVAVPTATYTGWALRAGPAAGDGCDAAGQKINFAQTKAERIAKGDPRLSIEERYPTHDVYVKNVTDAAQQLLQQRFLLAEDVQRYTQRAQASDIGK